MGMQCQQCRSPSGHFYQCLCARLVAWECTGWGWGSRVKQEMGVLFLGGVVGICGHGIPQDHGWRTEPPIYSLFTLLQGPDHHSSPHSPTQAPVLMSSPMCLWYLYPRAPMSLGNLALMVAICRDSVSGIPHCE